MTPPPEAARITVRDRVTALDDAHTWLRTFLQDRSLEAKLHHDLELITEELVVNSLQHNRTSALCITLSAWLDGDFIWLEFQDRGAEFNPLAASTPELSDDIVQRQPGGLGIHLVKQLADQVGYRYQAGVNHLWVSKRL